MSFTKKYLLGINEVIESIEDSAEYYYLTTNKVDLFIGSTESIHLTDEFIKKYKEDPKQDFKKLTKKYK